MSASYVSIAKVGDIPPDEGRNYPVNGRMVAVFLVDGEYFAIDDACPHMGASLSAGYVENGGVTCPWHAWRFSVRDGSWLDSPKSPLRVPCHEIRVEGNDIQLRVEG